MSTMLRTLGLGCTLLGAAAALQAASGTTYKWVDDQGVTHYGDTVPNDAIQKDRALLNIQGVEVGRVTGARSAAEKAAEKARSDREQQSLQHDQFLIGTYGSVKDIESLRDERLDQIDGQIKATTLYIDSLDTRLRALQDRALTFKPYSNAPGARRMPDDLAEDLVRAVTDRRSQVTALDKRRRELVDVRSQFDSDIARYRELAAHNGR